MDLPILPDHYYQYHLVTRELTADILTYPHS
jgi:hypothetical protein